MISPQLCHQGCGFLLSGIISQVDEIGVLPRFVQHSAVFALRVEELLFLLLERKQNKMYYKRCIGRIIVQKAENGPRWIQWTHNLEGKTHCRECLKLDGCWFQWDRTPKWPHHPGCHCTLDPIDYALVQSNAAAHSDYSKFDPYLFNTTGIYTHNKENLFKEWGYTVEDASWLQAEIERQSQEKYISGEYRLGKLDDKGQRISIRVTIPRKDTGFSVSFLTGWMVYPDGRIHLTTPYGGK